MVRRIAFAVVILAAGCSSSTSYDPLAHGTAAAFDVRVVESRVSAEPLPADLRPESGQLCAVGPELDALKPMLSDDGVGVFEHEGQLIELTVRPIPERITTLWDQGKWVAWSCRLE